MIISGMNRYFAKHGRIIGLVILPIIIVTFVFYFGRGSIMDMFSSRGKAANLSLVGRTVTLSDRQDEITRMYILASLQNPAISLANARMPLDSQGITFNLLQYYAAEDMGLAIGDKEIREYLKTVPVFQTAGQFDAKKYDLYVSDKLKPAYLTQDDLKDAVQRMLQIQALKKTVSDSVIAPESEIMEAYMNDMQSVDAKVLKFTASDYTKGIALKDEDLQNYYTNNKAKYQTAPASKGKFVTFAFDSFRKEALDLVTEKEMQKYYDDNKYRYRVAVKNNTEDVKKKAKKEAPKFKSFESVKADIKKTLADKKVEELAQVKAQKFADAVALLTSDVFYDINDKEKAKIKCLEIFKQSADKEKLKVEESGWLYPGNKNAKGFAKEPAFVASMTALFEDNPVSEPVKVSKGFLVAVLEDTKKSEPESFEDVKEDIRKTLSETKAVQLTREKARDIALKIGEQLDKGKKIEEIEKEMNLKFEKLPQWSSQMLGYFRGNTNIQTLALQLAFKTQQGTISPVTDSEDGAFLVYVAKRNIPTKAEFEKQKTMFSRRYKMMKQSSAYQNFLASLMKNSQTESK